MDYLCRLHLVAGFQAEGWDCNPHSGDHHRCDLASAPCGPAVSCSLGHFLSLCKQSSFRAACSQVDGHQSWRFGVLIRKGETLLGLFIVVDRQDRVLCPVLPGYSTQQVTQETRKRYSLHQPPYSMCFPMVCDTESVTTRFHGAPVFCSQLRFLRVRPTSCWSPCQINILRPQPCYLRIITRRRRALTQTP